MEKKKVNKIGNFISNVILYLFLALCILMVCVTILSKRDSDGAAEIFGYQMRVVVSDSMGACELTDVSDYDIKSIPIRSIIFVEVMPSDPTEVTEWYRSLREGDVVTFRYVYNQQITITHRITSITEKKTGGFLIELAGDNKNSESDQLYQVIDTSIPNNTNYVIGKVVGSSYIFGLIMSLLMSPAGIVFIIMVPCLVIISFEVSRIVKLLTSDKKKREKEEKEQKEKELEELRRRLAELEKASGVKSNASQSTDRNT